MLPFCSPFSEMWNCTTDFLIISPERGISLDVPVRWNWSSTADSGSTSSSVWSAVLEMPVVTGTLVTLHLLAWSTRPLDSVLIIVQTFKNQPWYRFDLQVLLDTDNMCEMLWPLCKCAGLTFARREVPTQLLAHWPCIRTRERIRKAKANLMGRDKNS